MRSAVLLALFGLAIASSQWPTRHHVSEQYFRAGREYRYRFDGLVSAGIPVPGEQSSATRLQTLVHIQPEDDRYVRLQLVDPSFANDQTEYRKIVAYGKIDTVPVKEEYERALRLPIRFSYRNGLVSDIEFSHEEQTWSANIKRAVVNMLQINLIKKGINEKIQQSEWEQDQENDFFVATERTIEGECEVTYTKLQRSEQQQWTKAINFEKCSIRPEVTYGRRYSEKCEECEKTLSDEKLSSTVMTYNVSGTPEQYLIHSVELQSQHSMAPLSEEQQLIVVRVINKMELVYAGKIAKEIPVVRGERKETLIYNPEWELAEEKFAMTGDEKYLRRIPFWGNRVEMIQQQISKLSKQIEDGVELETTHLVARLVKLIRLATEEELNTIRRHVSEKNEKVQALYIDVLALAGTKNTIYQLFEKMNTKEISPVKAAQLFKILAELRTPSKPILDMFWRFCDSTRSSVVRQSCWLSYGSVLNGVCGDHADKFASIYETKKMCSRSEKEEYVHQIVEKINQAETRYEKILFVKTLANSAVDVSVPHLEKIIMNQQVEKAVRVQAVDALRRLRRVMPKKIQNVLVPIYKSYKETPEIRMTALNVLLQTQPEQGVLDMIVRGIENERNQQVRVFTYTSLKTLSETTNPCEKTFAIRIAQALTTLPEQEVAILDSRLKTISSYNGIMGTNWNFATLFTNESVLPKEISASLETVFGGQWNKYLAQVGLMQNNFDKLISELLKTVEKSGLENIIVRGKRSVISRPTELLRSLFESLKINHRRVNTEEPRAMLYFRYKDMDFAFVPMNIDTMPEMIRRVLREGQLDISELEKILTGRFGLTGAAFFHESIRTLPTALGMPVVFSAKNPTVAALHGSVKFDLEPKNSDRVNGLRVRIVAKPQVAWTHVTKVEIMCPVVSSGMKLLHGGRVNTPVDTEIEINWEKKLTIKNTFKTPVENRHLVHITSRPVVFYRQWRKEQYPEAKETTVQLRNVEKNEFERVFERNGLKAIVSGQYTDDLFYGENVIDVVVEPKEDIPKEVISHLTLQIFEDIEMEKPSMFHNFFEKNAELFNTESSEYKEESESDRRRAFHNYVKQLKTDKAYRHRMLLKMETTPKTEEVEMGIRCECDEHMRFCRVKMDMKIPTEEERKPWEMRLTAESLYPEMSTSFKKMFNQPHREYVGAIQASWGSEEKNDVLLRIQGEQSRAQKKWMRRVDREQNGLTETEKLYNAAKLNQYKVLVDYELTPKNQMYLENGISLIQVWKMWKTTVEPSKEEIRNHMKLQFTTDMEMTWNVTAWTSEKTIMIQDLELPYYMAVIPSTNIRKTYGGIRSVKHVAKLIEKESRPECVVKSKEIKTFDGTFFKAPLTTCYSVLSKDCSSQEPEFAVLMKKITPQGEKSLKVISPEYEIVMEKSEGEMILRVNGKQVEDEEQWEQYGVTKEGEYYKIDIENIVCHFDGFHAKVKLSPLYKNKQCGICGHFDGERDNEFRRADNEETEDIEEFHRSYLIKDSECRVEEEQLSKKTNYKRLDEETSSSEEHYDDDTREPVLRHRLVERGQKVCFSVKSVKTCPKNTREEKFDEESVSFKCLRRSEPLAQRLLRSYRQQEIIVDELSEYEVVFEKEIRIPRMCTVY